MRPIAVRRAIVVVQRHARFRAAIDSQPTLRSVIELTGLHRGAKRNDCVVAVKQWYLRERRWPVGCHWTGQYLTAPMVDPFSRRQINAALRRAFRRYRRDE